MLTSSLSDTLCGRSNRITTTTHIVPVATVGGRASAAPRKNTIDQSRLRSPHAVVG